MYLSRVEIDLNNRKNIKELSHLGAYHNWVESSFPEEFNTSTRTRKLWRRDKLNDKEYLLIVSENSPSKLALEKYGVEGTAQIKRYDKFLNEIKEGGKYRFRIVANPVISIMREAIGNRGKVKPLPNDKQIDFLVDRSEKHGFELKENEFSIVKREHVIFKKKSQRVQLNKVEFEGVLTVTNKLLFVNMLINGFGKKKAYGFGMMTVIPEE